MAHTIRSLQRLVSYLIITLVITIATVIIFRQFISTSISLSRLVDQAVTIVIIIFSWSTALIIIRRFKPFISGRIGNQASTIAQYVMVAIVSLLTTFGILTTLQVSAAELLTGAGIISITVGLIISTFVGSILSGFLVFTNYQFRVGDRVIVNKTSGVVTEMTALVMRIQTDVGSVTIPNSAIASGGVIITAVRKYEGQTENRLHYTVGDRVITSYMNEQGIVTELTPYHTVVQLDSGKEITYLNNSVLSGMVPIARIAQVSTAKKAQPT